MRDLRAIVIENLILEAGGSEAFARSATSTDRDSFQTRRRKAVSKRVALLARETGDTPDVCHRYITARDAGQLPPIDAEALAQAKAEGTRFVIVRALSLQQAGRGVFR